MHFMVQPAQTIVIAEDEPLTRMVAVAALTDAGFAVIETEHADAALVTLRSRAADVHILFTDIHMPGSMNGLELAHHVSTHWPWIGVLIASGHARPEIAELPLGSRFLAKPYDPDHAVAQVTELMTEMITHRLP